MTQNPWISALNIPQATYDSWLELHPQSEPLLLWCLATNQISSEQYFKWAQEHYGLAYLSSEFFQQTADYSLWNKIKTVANWTAEMIPVLEWDGVIFIICVEPQLEIKWSFPVQFVLASANDLKKYWGDLHPEAQSELRPEAQSEIYPETEIATEIATKIEPIMDAPEGLVIPTNFKLNLADPESSVIQIKQVNNAPEGLSPKMLPSDPVTNSHSHYVDFLFKLENYFLGAMVLTVTNEQIKALAWDSKFKPKTTKAESFWSLNNASAFRVVFRTKLPYLGHVVDTPINREFFNSWGFDNLPNTILVQPVKTESQITHLLLLLTNGEIKNHNILSIAEKFSVEFSQLMANVKAA